MMLRYTLRYRVFRHFQGRLRHYTSLQAWRSNVDVDDNKVSPADIMKNWQDFHLKSGLQIPAL